MRRTTRTVRYVHFIAMPPKPNQTKGGGKQTLVASWDTFDILSAVGAVVVVGVSVFFFGNTAEDGAASASPASNGRSTAESSLALRGVTALGNQVIGLGEFVW